MKKKNYTHLILYFVISIIFTTAYLNFDYYHDDYLNIYQIPFKNFSLVQIPNEINLSILENIFFYSRYIDYLILRDIFFLIKDNLLIYNLIKILLILLISFEINYILKNFFHKKFINLFFFLFLINPLTLGTTYWASNIDWLILTFFHLLSLIIFISNNKSINKFIFCLVINHIISINLPLMVFNFLIFFIYFNKINNKNFFKYSLLLVQLILSLVVIYLTLDKKNIFSDEINFILILKPFIKNIAFFFYDFYQIYNFAFIFIIIIFFYSLIKYKINFLNNFFLSMFLILFLNYLILSFGKYNFRFYDIESRVAINFAIFFHIFLFNFINKIKSNQMQKLFLFFIVCLYVFGFFNHYIKFYKYKINQNKLISKLELINLNKENYKLTLNVQGTTFDNPDKIRYYMFIKTNNKEWLKTEIYLNGIVTGFDKLWN
jgi:hypothetical protein